MWIEDAGRETTAVSPGPSSARTQVRNPLFRTDRREWTFGFPSGFQRNIVFGLVYFSWRPVFAKPRDAVVTD